MALSESGGVQASRPSSVFGEPGVQGAASTSPVVAASNHGLALRQSPVAPGAKRFKVGTPEKDELCWQLPQELREMIFRDPRLDRHDVLAVRSVNRATYLCAADADFRHDALAMAAPDRAVRAGEIDLVDLHSLRDTVRFGARINFRLGRLDALANVRVPDMRWDDVAPGEGSECGLHPMVLAGMASRLTPEFFAVRGSTDKLAAWPSGSVCSAAASIACRLISASGR